MTATARRRRRHRRRRALDWAARAMGGTIVQPGTRGTHFAGANHDSRAVAPGQLFFAFPGERVDGFDFAAQAAAAGAAGIVVSRARGVPAGCEGVAIIAVDDPRRAMGDVARAARAEFRGLVVGVTGSNGKTTTKELCAAALQPARRRLPHRRQPQHRRRPAAHDPVRDRERGGVGAGDGDARARRDRLPGGGRAPAHRRHHQRRRRAPRAPALARRRSRAPRASCSRGLEADGWAVLPATDPLITAQAAHVRRRAAADVQRAQRRRRARAGRRAGGRARFGGPLRAPARAAGRAPAARRRAQRARTAPRRWRWRCGRASRRWRRGAGAGEGRAAAAPIGDAGGRRAARSSTTATTPTRRR